MRESELKKLFGRIETGIPVVSPSQVVIEELMEKVGIFWPEGLREAEKMAKLALAGHTVLGFQSVRLPFDRMIEVEALGANLVYSKGIGFPEVERYLASPLYEFSFPRSIIGAGRTPEVLKAIWLVREATKAAVFGGMLGPFSILCHMFGPVKVIKATVKKPSELVQAMESVTSLLIEYGKEMVRAGADVVVIEEEFVSPKMISPKFFRNGVAPMLKKVVKKVEVPVILHLCEDITMLAEDVLSIGPAGLSVDHHPNLSRLSTTLKEKVLLLGNVDTYNVLVVGSVKDVKEAVKEAVDGGIDFVAPGGPLLPQTPMRNVLALTEAASELGNLERC